VENKSDSNDPAARGFSELRRPASVVGLRLPRLGFSVEFSARKSEAEALNSRSLEAEA